MGKGKKKHYKRKGRSNRIQQERATHSNNEASNEATKSEAPVDISSKAAEGKKKNFHCLNCGANIKNYGFGEYAFESQAEEEVNDENKLPDETKISEMACVSAENNATFGEKQVHQTKEKSKQRNFQKVVSDNRKEFIKEEEKPSCSQYSGRIRIKALDSLFQLTFGYFGSKNLIVIDSLNFETFVGNIQITDVEELNFSQSFKYNKAILLDKITITKILVDELLNKRNKACESFLRTVEKRSDTISDNLDCTEDFLQFLLIGRSPNLTSENPLMLLENIIQNEYISSQVKQEAKQLKDVESLLSTRNHIFPKFSENINPKIADLFTKVRDTCQKGITNHKRNLLNKCPNTNFRLPCLIASINHLPKQNLLYINNNDIELFSNMMELTYENYCYDGKIFPENFVEYLWNKFYEKIQAGKQKSVKQFGPITNPIYFFLLKSLRLVITDICAKQRVSAENLISYKEGELTMPNFVPRFINDPLNKSLEEQYRLIFRLVKHFEPGFYSNQNKFIYTFRLLKENETAPPEKTKKNVLWKDAIVDFKNIAQERIVWIYVVDCGLAPILDDNSKSCFKQLSLSVLAGFVKFIQKFKHDQYEKFHVTAHNIIKFIFKLHPYFSADKSVLTNVDYDILDKQIEIIRQSLCSNDNDIVSEYFSYLINIYIEYWKYRESIVGKLPIICSFLKPDMEIVREKLLLLVQSVLLKELKPLQTIMFLRMYNEFLKHLKGIDFTWVISKHCYIPVLDGVVEKTTQNDIISYTVTNPEDFVEILKKNQKIYPKHFSIEVVKKLLDVISMSIDKMNWTGEDCVKAAGDLFLAIGHSFAHFADQTDYIDLEHFMRDCTLPFHCVIENSTTYSEFKQRLDNVENFYLYSRKQNQIGIKQAIDLCVQDGKKSEGKGFQINFERSILEECYNRYSKKLVSLKNMKISDILNDIENEIKSVKNLTLDKWSLDFKQNILPVLLADLAAVWSLQESEDLAYINKRIEPHCVQILCILRLLGVDHIATGVPKHFAQVLTGQGKSLILALLSAVIALTGNEAFVVCYSDYLAQRDQSSFEPFFKVFNRFDVKNKISYNTFIDMAKKILSRKVDGTETSLTSVVANLVLNKLQAKSIDVIEIPKNTVLLFDEADVFFSETFYGKTFDPVAHVNIPALLEIQTMLWSIIEDGVSEKNTILKKTREFVIDLIKDEEYDDFRNFIKTTTDLFEKYIKKLVENAVSASNEINDAFKTDENSYILPGGQSIKEKFKHLFLSGTFCKLSVDLGSISYASLPLRYENILGVSGTLVSLSDSEIKAMKNYGIQTMSVTPSFFGDSKLAFKPSENVSIFDSQEIWLDNIYRNIRNKTIWINHAVLVFFKTESELKLFDEKYRNKFYRLHTLTGNESTSTMEWQINHTGVAQTVTLATRSMGRGVDYKSNDRSVEKNGGIHVIQTFFSLDEKEETQIKGRTARKDNKGSYELILCREHLKSLNCSKTETGKSINTYMELCKAREKIAAEKTAVLQKNIEKSEKMHTMTLEFFDSLGNYSPEKRHEYLSKFPFVKPE